MLLPGATPPGRTIEQHDIFFGIGPNLRSLIPDILNHWPEANGAIHLDGWQQLQYANGYEITVRERSAGATTPDSDVRLFFINLGGYKPGEFEEYHYKMVVAATDKSSAIKLAKDTAFYKHTGYKGAESHIDDKYGIDVDDAYAIDDILPAYIKEKYAIELRRINQVMENELHIGYFQLSKI